MPKVAEHSIFGNLMNGERVAVHPCGTIQVTKPASWHGEVWHLAKQNMTWRAPRKTPWWALLCFAHQGSSRCKIRIFAFLPPSTRGTVWAWLFDPAKAGPSRHMQTCSSFDPTEQTAYRSKHRASEYLFKPTSFVLGNLAARYSSVIFHLSARKSNTNEPIHHSESWVP